MASVPRGCAELLGDDRSRNRLVAHNNAQFEMLSPIGGPKVHPRECSRDYSQIGTCLIVCQHSARNGAL